jgi:hypothetical protein
MLYARLRRGLIASSVMTVYQRSATGRVCLSSILSTLKCFAGAPSGRSIPHALMKDDVYNGYIIPNGSIVIVIFGAQTRSKRFASQAALLTIA